MALVKTSKAVLSIKGRCGGVYFKKDGTNQHIQAMPRIVRYSRSTLQAPGIEGYSEAALFWLMALVIGFAAVWAGFAAIWLFTDDEGRKKKISGYNWYIHYALTFPETEALPFWKPPHSPSELPDYYAVWKGQLMYRTKEKDWSENCCGGYYWLDGEWNGRPEYKTDDSKWWLWWKAPHWVLSWGLDIELPDSTYYSIADKINDYYYNPVTNIYATVYIGKRD